MRFFLTTFSAAALLATGSAPLAAQHQHDAPYRQVATAEMDADARAVATVVQDLFDAMRAGDSATVRRVFHPEARMITSFRRNGNVVLNIEEDGVDGFANAVGTPHEQVWDERVWNVTIMIDDDLAMAWMDYAFFAGTTFSHCGIDLFEFARTTDGWKIIGIADTRRREGCELPEGLG